MSILIFESFSSLNDENDSKNKWAYWCLFDRFRWSQSSVWISSFPLSYCVCLNIIQHTVWLYILYHICFSEFGYIFYVLKQTFAQLCMKQVYHNFLSNVFVESKPAADKTYYLFSSQLKNGLIILQYVCINFSITYFLAKIEWPIIKM